MVQFYRWFTFCFPLFWGTVIHDNEFKTILNKILKKVKIAPQHIVEKERFENQFPYPEFSATSPKALQVSSFSSK